VLFRSLEAAARHGENLMPPLLAGVRAYASVGEMCNVLRAVYGTHRESV